MPVDPFALAALSYRNELAATKARLTYQLQHLVTACGHLAEDDAPPSNALLNVTRDAAEAAATAAKLEVLRQFEFVFLTDDTTA